MFEVGQWLTATRARPRRATSPSSNQIPVCQPDPVVEPADPFQVVHRSAAEALAAPGLLVLGLGEMRVETDAVTGGKRAAEWRDPQHREAIGVSIAPRRHRNRVGIHPLAQEFFGGPGLAANGRDQQELRPMQQEHLRLCGG